LFHILVAEDDANTRRLFETILQKAGYSVYPAANGEDALSLMDTQHIDLIVLDIMMPKMDGISVLENMRNAQNFTPVLLLTAKAEIEDRISGLKAGADDYLAKPFAMGELIARIEALTRRNNDYVITQVTGGNITLDCTNNEMSTDVGSLILSTRETALLTFFLQHLNSDLAENELREVLDTEDKMAVKLYTTYLKNKLRQIHADLTIAQDGDIYRME
jgi:DNA-binding response OmpR family regulator